MRWKGRSVVLVVVGMALAACTGNGGTSVPAESPSSETMPNVTTTPTCGLQEATAAVQRFFAAWNGRRVAALDKLFDFNTEKSEGFQMSAKDQGAKPPTNDQWTTAVTAPSLNEFASAQWGLGSKLSYESVQTFVGGANALDTKATFADGSVQPMSEAKFGFDCNARAFSHVVIIAPTPAHSAAGTTSPSSVSNLQSPTHRHAVELTCNNATTSAGSPRGPADLVIGGLTLEDAAHIEPSVSRAADVGVMGAHGFFRKVPAYLRGGSPPITIELVAPSTGAALAWVPAGVWTGDGPPNVSQWLTTKVILDGCSDSGSTYLGGLVADDPATCLALHVSQDGKPGVQARFQLDGKPC
jgi:hypothetical protein